MNTERIDAKVVALSISKKRGTTKHNVDSVEIIEDYGIVGDAHAGKWHKQISLLAMESIERFNNESGFNVKAGEFSENITTEGIDILTSIPIKSVIKIGRDVVLEVTQHGKKEKEGCPIFARVKKCMLPLEGIFAKVLKGGVVKVGDPIRILK